MENQDMQKPEVSPTPTLTADFSVKTCHAKWEKLLPKKFIIAAMEENPTSLKLKLKRIWQRKNLLHLLWIVEQPGNSLIDTTLKAIVSTLSSSSAKIIQPALAVFDVFGCL